MVQLVLGKTGMRAPANDVRYHNNDNAYPWARQHANIHETDSRGQAGTGH